jgi:two-component system aerobic respiration control sensor histidine kinase ArcB
MENPNLLIQLSHDLEIIFLNAKAATIYNFEQTECFGKPYAILATHTGANSILDKSLFHTEKYSENIITEIIRSPTQHSQVTWTIAPGYCASGQSQYWLIGYEISVLTNLAEQCQNLQNYLDSIVAQIPGYLYWKDLNSVYLGCNGNFAKVAGLQSPSAIIGKTDYDLSWGKTEAELFRKGDKEVLAGQLKLNFEEPQLMANGKHAIVLANKVPLYNAKGAIIGIVGLYTDITERKMVERELAATKLQAEAANQLKSDFLATISHELRTPLSGIISVADLFKLTKLDAGQQELLDMLTTSGRLLLRLVDDLLDVSKFESGHFELVTEYFDLKQLTDHVLKSLKYRAEEKNLALNLSYDESIPSYILADPQRMRQILLNLLSNAIKFTFTGSIQLEISVGQRDYNSIVLIIRVIDTGIGIAEANLTRIFDRFYQIENTNKGRYRGAGLGLAITRQIVRQLNGELTVSSVLGQGSTFTCIFTLPYKLELD